MSRSCGVGDTEATVPATDGVVGSACSDQEACTLTDSCLEGACIPGACAVGLNCTICGGTCADTAGCHCEF